jgi:hypothetical protein
MQQTEMYGERQGMFLEKYVPVRWCAKITVHTKLPKESVSALIGKDTKPFYLANPVRLSAPNLPDRFWYPLGKEHQR